MLVALHRLRALGVSIAMDDFGTGYSSLSYLTMFPFDRIKIDRTFTLGLAQRPKSLAVIRAVTGMCTSLGIVSIAEGVETATQLGLLDDEHCDEVQGYLFSQPGPQREAELWLESWNSMESDTVSAGAEMAAKDAF
ncbi:EAL domain-containing protein [Caballeronia sp. SEWSISQ10-4 2]|nr:EAL domain-containing protein [Caballeronia sp. SEWSISQ10-4 2]